MTHGYRGVRRVGLVGLVGLAAWLGVLSAVAGPGAAVVRPAATNAPVMLSWEPSEDAWEVAGYRVYWGAGSGEYAECWDVGMGLSCLMSVPTARRTYAAVTCYNHLGEESVFSGEARWPQDRVDSFSGPGLELATNLAGPWFRAVSPVVLTNAWGSVGGTNLFFRCYPGSEPKILTWLQ